MGGHGNLPGGGLSLQGVWQPSGSIRQAPEQGWLRGGCAQQVRVCSDGKFGVGEEADRKVSGAGDGVNSCFLSGWV